MTKHLTTILALIALATTASAQITNSLPPLPDSVSFPATITIPTPALELLSARFVPAQAADAAQGLAAREASWEVLIYGDFPPGHQFAIPGSIFTIDRLRGRAPYTFSEAQVEAIFGPTLYLGIRFSSPHGKLARGGNASSQNDDYTRQGFLLLVLEAQQAAMAAAQL